LSEERVRFTGRDLTEALAAARARFGLPRHEVAFEVIAKPKPGLMGAEAGLFEIEAWPNPGAPPPPPPVERGGAATATAAGAAGGEAGATAASGAIAAAGTAARTATAPAVPGATATTIGSVTTTAGRPARGPTTANRSSCSRSCPAPK
jgi:hypothetical protein